MTAKANRSLKQQLLALGLAVAFCVIYLIFGDMLGVYVPCIFRKITHLYCPGCGITRMLAAILTGDFYQALRYNPLICILLPLVIVYLVDYLINQARGRKSLLVRTPNWVWILMIVALVIYGIMRNLSWFKYLAPTEV